jgi:hypothetical protein
MERASWTSIGAKEDQRQDEEALRTAVMSLVYRAQDGLA